MKSRLLKILLLVIILLATVSGLAWYLLNDSAFLKGQLSSRLEKATGWQLSVQGDLDVAWGRTSIIAAQDIQLINPYWQGDPLLFSAVSLRLELEPLELLDLSLVMNELVLADCVVRFAESADEAVNWSLAKTQDEVDSPAGSGDSGFNWKLSKLSITDCQASVARKNHYKPLEIVLSQADLVLDSENSLTVSAKGSVDQQLLSLDGEISPLRAVWEGGHLTHKIRLEAGQTSLHSKGTIEDFGSGSGANLEFRFAGPEFRNIAQWLGVPEFSDGPFDAGIDLQENPTTGFMEIGVDGDLGSMQIRGTGKLDRLVAPTSGSVDVRVKGPDLDALGRTLGLDWLIEQPYELELIADIEQGKTQLESVWLEAGENRFSASGYLGPWPGLLGSQLEVKIHSPELVEWQPASEDGFRISGPLDNTTLLTVGPTGELLLDGTSHLGGGTMHVKGSVGTLEELGNPLVSVLLEAPSLEKFALILGKKGLPDLPFIISGGLQHEGDELQLKDVEIYLAGDRLFASGSVHMAEELRGSHIEARLMLDDLASSGQRFGIKDLPAQALQVTARLSRDGEGLKFDVQESDLGGIKIKMIGEIPDIKRLFVMNAEFDVDLPSLQLAGFLAPGHDLPDLPFAAKGKALITAKDHMQVRGVELVLGQSKADIEADLKLGADLQGSSANLSLRGADIKELWPQAPIELELSAYSLEAKWQRNKGGDYLDGVKLDLGVLKVGVDAHVTDLGKPENFDANVTVDADDASRLNALSGQPFTPEPISLKFQLAGNPDLLAFNQLEYRQGNTDIAGTLRYTLQTRPRLSGTLQSDVFDASPWQQQVTEEQEKAATAGERESQDSGRVFSDEPFDPAAKIPLNLDLDIRVGRLVLVNNEVRQLTLGLLVEEEKMQVQPFEMMGKLGGHYKGHFLTSTENGLSTVELKTDVENMRLTLAASSSMQPEKLPPLDALVELKGKGKSYRELVRSLEGKVHWYAGPGMVANSNLNFFFSDLLTEVFSSLNPLKKKSTETTLKCGVISAVFANEKVRIEPLVIQTDQLTAFSEGTIDLASEAIDLNFNTVARKGLGISASSVVNPFFKIGGTLQHPAIQLDVTKGVISGGTIVATAGLSILYKSVADRLLSSKDPCGDARATIKARDKSAE